MYTFLLVSPTGSIPAFDFAQCADDDAARHAARRLLRQQPERRAVEIWNDNERVDVVERDS